MNEQPEGDAGMAEAMSEKVSRENAEEYSRQTWKQ
jgi:hypothetical protein